MELTEDFRLNEKAVAWILDIMDRNVVVERVREGQDKERRAQIKKGIRDAMYLDSIVFREDGGGLISILNVGNSSPFVPPF
jgi:hypothetical protein